MCHYSPEIEKLLIEDLIRPNKTIMFQCYYTSIHRGLQYDHSICDPSMPSSIIVPCVPNEFAIHHEEGNERVIDPSMVLDLRQFVIHWVNFGYGIRSDFYHTYLIVVGNTMYFCDFEFLVLWKVSCTLYFWNIDRFSASTVTQARRS